MIDAADIPRLMEENFAAHLAYLARRFPGARVMDEPDVLLVDSGLCSDTFNKVARARASSRDGEAAANLVNRCVDHFRASGRPFAWWLGPESGLSELETHLAAAGLTPTEEETGMALRLSSLPEEPEAAPAGLSCRTLRDEADVRTFASIIADTWDPPDTEILRFYEAVVPSVLAPGGPFRGWLAELDGKAVAATEVFHTPGAAGVYSVSTLRAYRGRGVATALIRAALAQASAEGARLGFLQAATGALEIYRRLGFVETGRFEEWGLRG